MALLNPPQILPNVARVLYRALHAADASGLSRDDLAKAVAPASLPRGDGAPSGAGSKALDDTIAACITIGLIERQDDQLGLHPGLPAAARDRRHWDAALPSIVLDLVLDERLNHGLWESTEGARDLTRALAWFLGQDTLAPPAAWNEPNGADIAQERQVTGTERIFSNDTRWGAFDRWVTFLGLGTRLPREGKSLLVPDPTSALRSVLPELSTAARQPVLDFTEAVGRRLPVLDGGIYRRAIEERMRPEAVLAAEDLLSPSLAHALLRLRDERLLTLEDLADAPAKVRLPIGFGPERTISHVFVASRSPGRGSRS